MTTVNQENEIDYRQYLAGALYSYEMAALLIGVDPELLHVEKSPIDFDRARLINHELSSEFNKIYFFLRNNLIEAQNCDRAPLHWWLQFVLCWGRLEIHEIPEPILKFAKKTFDGQTEVDSEYSDIYPYLNKYFNRDKSDDESKYMEPTTLTDDIEITQIKNAIDMAKLIKYKIGNKMTEAKFVKELASGSNEKKEYPITNHITIKYKMDSNHPGSTQHGEILYRYKLTDNDKHKGWQRFSIRSVFNEYRKIKD